MFTLNFIFFKVTMVFHRKEKTMAEIENDARIARLMKEIEEKRYEYRYWI